MISSASPSFNRSFKPWNKVQDLTNVARLMQQELDVKDRSVPRLPGDFTARHQSRLALITVATACRSYHFKTYRQCFVGSNAVQWLLSAGYAEDAAEAVQMGNDMLHLGLLNHVKHEHAFENRLGYVSADLIALHQVLCCCHPGCLAAGTSSTGGPARAALTAGASSLADNCPRSPSKGDRQWADKDGPTIAAWRASRPPDHIVAAWPVYRLPGSHCKAKC